MTQRRDEVREGVTMALYISLSLLAVLTVSSPSGDSQGAVASTVLLTSLGLLAAHVVAFAVSSRLVSHGQLDVAGRREIVAQLAAGLVVTIVATLPTLILPLAVGLQVAETLLVGFVCGVALLAARQSGASWLRAGVYALVVLALVSLVLVVKSLVGH